MDNNSQLQPINNQYYDNPVNELTLQDYIVILRIHLKKIIILTLIGLGYGIYHTYTIPPQFHSTATVMVREKPGADMVVDFGESRNRNRMENEIQLIKSRALAKDVVKELWNSIRRNNLHVFGTRKFYPRGQRPRRIAKELLTLGLYDPTADIPGEFDEPYSNAIGERFAGSILSGLSINRRRNTDILEITVTSINADEASRIANSIARNYVRLDKIWSSEHSRKAVEFLESLTVMQEEKLNNAELEIKNFRIKNKMYTKDGEITSVTTQLVEMETEVYNSVREINIRKEKISALKSRLSQEEKNLAEQLLTNINAQLISLRIEIGTLESQLLQNITLYGEEHGAVKGLKTKLDKLREQLNEKVAELVNQGITVQDPLMARQETVKRLLTYDSEIMALKITIDESKKMQKIFSDKLNNLPQKQLELAGLERGIDILNQNYTYMRQKLEEAKLNVAIQVGNAQFVDSAQKPSRPSSPDHRRNILMSLIIGLGAGVFLSFLIEFLDNTLKTVDDIDKHGLSVLGIIPSIGGDPGKKRRRGIFSKKPLFSVSSSSHGLRRRLITREDPKSPVSEAYRSLRTSMLYSTANNDIKSILISSAGPGEGKTTTVANLAITYANLGRKTLLVDTDLRRPVVHKVFDLDREPGVTTYLSAATDDYN
ncbi:MAG: Wzz/FepE/Etk N-terminal domain-containing protein, partial [Candidatus Neomarinimicrobiota bacterium]|nr:Wzz/FepE/Etk N-terminal domain-containing protein [Candidatus Neomarinimicrobiota bacterium]